MTTQVQPALKVFLALFLGVSVAVALLLVRNYPSLTVVRWPENAVVQVALVLGMLWANRSATFDEDLLTGASAWVLFGVIQIAAVSFSYPEGLFEIEFLARLYFLSFGACPDAPDFPFVAAIWAWIVSTFLAVLLATFLTQRIRRALTRER